MTFLTRQWIDGIERLGFYNDWKPGPYGPFSPSLNEDTDLLSRIGDIRTETTQISLDAHMETFTILPLGESHAVSIQRAYPKQTEAIKRMIVDKYAKAPLMSLLHDVYYSFPQYTIRSEIAGEVFDMGQRRERNY
jgi:hypothetical protein